MSEKIPRNMRSLRGARSRAAAVAACLGMVLAPVPAGAPELFAAADPPAPETKPAESAPRDESKRLAELWQTGKNAERRGDYAEALKAFNAILEINPDDVWAALHADLCLKQVKSDETLERLDRDEYRALRQAADLERNRRGEVMREKNRLERQYREEQREWERLIDASSGAEDADFDKARRDQAMADRLSAASGLGAAEERAQAEIAALESKPEEEQAEPEVSLGRVTAPLSGEEEVARRRPPPGEALIDAQQLSFERANNKAIAVGDAEVLYDTAILRSDRITVFTDTGDVYCEGNVSVEDEGNLYRGEMAQYNVNTKKARILEGYADMPPWHEHGEEVETVAEGVYAMRRGYLTSCDLDHPHFAFKAKSATVFAQDRLARAKHVLFTANDFPLLYFPRLTFADRQSPFYIIPGKKKPWGEFALMGYRFTPPAIGNLEQRATAKLDWRRNFGWGTGLDYQVSSEEFGEGLLKLYYNPEKNALEPVSALPKGAEADRYRVLWRHNWEPVEGTRVITDLQEYSDANFREELLFREEYVEDDTFGNSFVSLVTNTDQYTLSALVRKRLNRYERVTEALPQVAVDTRQQRIGDTWFFAKTRMEAANFQTKRPHSALDDEAVRVDWLQDFSYAMNWFAPLQVTPRAGVRQTFYNKDALDTTPQNDNVISGQFNTGVDSSIKFFRTFGFSTNFWNLNINKLRHVITPTVGYNYVHQPTVPNELLNFAAAPGPSNEIIPAIENKLQTKRANAEGVMRSVDLLRSTLQVPYTFAGSGNPHGGQLGTWTADVEAFPWPWMRLETAAAMPAHFDRRERDRRITSWIFDAVIVGGAKEAEAYDAPHIDAPSPQGFEAGPKGGLDLMPLNQWFLGIGQRYSQNVKTESVLQFDWRVSEKWQVGTFQRYTWKEVAGTSKRFNNLREHQYSLRRDLHDWIMEFVYRTDREYGEEVFLLFTLKAYPELPIEMETSYHQPKFGSQSSPFSPVQR